MALGFQESKGGSLLRGLFHQEDLPRPVWPFSQLSSGERRRMGLQCGTKGTQARELPSQGLKGSDGCQWRSRSRSAVVLQTSPVAERMIPVCRAILGAAWRHLRHV